MGHLKMQIGRSDKKSSSQDILRDQVKSNMNLRRENCFIDPGGQEERIISQQMNTTSVEISEK